MSKQNCPDIQNEEFKDGTMCPQSPGKRVHSKITPY